MEANAEEINKRKNELFYQYVNPHLNLIYSLVLKYSMQKQFIDDNYTQVLYNYYHYILTYNPELKIQTWLHIVCKRFVKSLEEKRSREMQGSDDVDIYDSKEFSTEQNSETWSSFGVDNWKEHLSDDMLYALAKIKPIYAEAFILQACGYSLKEIVEISHKNGNLKIKNIDTVKSRLFLARTQLKSIINRDGELLRENN